MFLFTVFMLAILAWLFFNAMNEKRWVEAHSHDESVASDQGFLPSFSSVSQSMRADGKAGGKVSIDQEDTRFARAVAGVKRRTAKYSDGLERRAAAARVDDANRPRSAADENDFFGRMVKRVGGFTQNMDAKIDRRMQSGRQVGEQAPRRSDSGSGTGSGSGSSSDGSSGSDTSSHVASQTSAFERMASKVAAGDDALGERMKQTYNARTAPDGQTRSFAEEKGVFNSIVGKVSGVIEKVEGKVDERLKKSHVDPADRDDPKNDDFLGRMSSKIGRRIDDVNERLVYPDNLAHRRGGSADNSQGGR